MLMLYMYVTWEIAQFLAGHKWSTHWELSL